MAQGGRDPRPGDLIEIDRPGYQHWALYVGRGYVIHVTDEGATSLTLSSSSIRATTAKVKKQLLKEVVGNDEWRVNNKYDRYYTPFAVEKIIQRAKQWIGREVPYDVLNRNCEHFVTELRYGVGVSEQSILQKMTFVGGKIPTPDTRYGKDYPNPGDLIDIKKGSYEHWALYMGDGYVIHMTPLDENAAPSSASSETIPIRKVKATKELLKEVVGNDDWAVNNKCDGYRTPLPVEEIIRRAEEQIGEEVQYDELGMYSEDFVKSLRYGGQMTRSISDCPKPGDLIEIYRPGYQHWALYLWSGYVIHVTAVDGNTSSLSASSVTIITKRAKVAKEPLEKVVGNDTWHVNNNNDRFRTPRPIGVIIQHAMEWIDKKWRYELLYSNCEHFVTMLRYGDGISWQAINTRLVPEVISTVFVKKTKSGDSVR
ncbi:uncharacterized protein LOC120495818 [Passer montanus]|uniref:uncharacterized protein LOC120495818 n=1 Tax=Passer montanus TaxID=9160 RepID=UPI00196071FC|nr:uncharacterized protein LOC120495818 [Passer montanus]